MVHTFAGKFSKSSPLARLVLFMVFLSIAGSCVAVSHYILVDRPAQDHRIHPPANGNAECDWTGYYTSEWDLSSQKAWGWLNGYYLVWTRPSIHLACWKYF